MSALSPATREVPTTTVSPTSIMKLVSMIERPPTRAAASRRALLLLELFLNRGDFLPAGRDRLPRFSPLDVRNRSASASAARRASSSDARLPARESASAAGFTPDDWAGLCEPEVDAQLPPGDGDAAQRQLVLLVVRPAQPGYGPLQIRESTGRRAADTICTAGNPSCRRAPFARQAARCCRRPKRSARRQGQAPRCTPLLMQAPL